MENNLSVFDRMKTILIVAIRQFDFTLQQTFFLS